MCEFILSPVVIPGVRLDQSIWTHEFFLKHFGDVKNVFDCRNGDKVPHLSMKIFREDFDNLDNRLKNVKGEPMLLKLMVQIGIKV